VTGDPGRPRSVKPAERRLLQLAVALGCIVPLVAGGSGMIEGPAMLAGMGSDAPADLDSHYRYLSGLLLAVGLAFATCIPAIERKTGRFRLLAFLVVVGGLGRLLSMASVGAPGEGHMFGLAMELLAVPLLVLWQARVAGGPE
jgi:nitrate reductase NapE component